MKLLASCLLSILAFALTPQQPATLKGQVTDQNGAIVVGAKITARSSTRQSRTTTADTSGSYSFANLAPGDYTIEASASSLALQEPINLQLIVFIPDQSVTVQDNNRTAVSTWSRTHRVYWPLQNVGGKPVLRITLPTNKQL